MAMRKKNSSNQISSHIDEETVSGLETSLISNSDLLSETTNSDIHKKYLEDKRLSQIELAEFEMIERDLDNIAVSPLLMSTEVKFPPRSNHSDRHPRDDVDNDHGQDVINSKWSNQSAEYYIGGNYSSQVSRKSQNRYQFSQTNESEYEPVLDKNDREYGDESDGDPYSEVDYPTKRQSDDENDDHELQEAVSTALIAETQFIRVSHSQNPFQGSSISKSSHKELYEDPVNSTQGSIDDSVSWGNSSSPMQTAIRPRLSNDSTRMSDPPNKSRNSPAPSRYHHTSHLSTGAIGDSSHDWDHKNHPPSSRKSPARSMSSGSTRQSQNRKSKESQNPNHEMSKSKIIVDEDILTKAKKLEEEIATYQ
jgi:hypothetical protein